MHTRRLFLAGLGAVFSAPALAQGKKSGAKGETVTTATVINVAGTYTAMGMNADGTKYEGVVTITQQNDLIGVAWKIGSDAFQGAGALNGLVLEVDWGDATPVVYVARPNGELHGTWGGGTALERLIPQ